MWQVTKTCWLTKSQVVHWYSNSRVNIFTTIKYKKLISSWTLLLEPRHHCTISLPSSCLQNDVLASRLLTEHHSWRHSAIFTTLTNTALDLWAQVTPTTLAYELNILQVTQGRSRSLKMAPIDRKYTTLYGWVCHCNLQWHWQTHPFCKYSLVLYHFLVMWRSK